MITIPNYSGPRYVVIERSVSAHCCFSHTVVDMIESTWCQPDDTDSEGYWNYSYSSICECFDAESANMICAALNKVDTKE